MKTNLPPETSWGQALDLMRQGKFPMDLAGMNPAGWLQMGTLLSKANLLQDETARLLGLTADAVPDDAFRAIKGLIEQSTQEAERLAAFSAATIDAVAMETTKAGDIVDIKSGKASHSFTFGGGTRNKVFDIAAQAYPESFTMLSADRAVRVKGSTVYLYNVTDSQFTQIASQTLNGGRSLGGTPVKISDTEFFCIGKDWFEDSESDNGGYYANQRYSYVKISGTTSDSTYGVYLYIIGTDAAVKGSALIPPLKGTAEETSGYSIIPFSSTKLLIILKDGRALIATRSGTSFLPTGPLSAGPLYF